MALWKNKAAEVLLCPCCEVPSLCQSHCFVVIPKRGLAMHVECGERGKKILSDECDGPTCMVSHTHEWFLFKKMHFHHDYCRITHDENEDVRKRNLEQFDQCFYRFFSFSY